MRLAAEYSVSLVCRILEYSRSSYYYQAREPDDQALQEALAQVAATWPTYGYRRISIQTYHGRIRVPWESLSEEKVHHQQ